MEVEKKASLTKKVVPRRALCLSRFLVKMDLRSEGLFLKFLKRKKAILQRIFQGLSVSLTFGGDPVMLAKGNNERGQMDSAIGSKMF